MLGLHTTRATTILATEESAANRYTSIREYASDATASELAAALQALPEQISQLSGFIDYAVIDGPGDRVLTITVFANQDGLDAAAASETEWIAANATSLLSTPPTELNGPVLLHAGVGAGSSCATGTEFPCGSDEFVCCADEDTPPGGSGICVPANYGCR